MGSPWPAGGSGCLRGARSGTPPVGRRDAEDAVWLRAALAPLAVVIGDRTRARIAADHDCDLVEPLGSPEFVASYTAFGGRWGGLTRAGGTRLLATGLLPEAVIGRRDKAWFNASRFGPISREFVRSWDGRAGSTRTSSIRWSCAMRGRRRCHRPRPPCCSRHGWRARAGRREGAQVGAGGVGGSPGARSDGRDRDHATDQRPADDLPTAGCGLRPPQSRGPDHRGRRTAAPRSAAGPRVARGRVSLARRRHLPAEVPPDRAPAPPAGAGPPDRGEARPRRRVSAHSWLEFGGRPLDPTVVEFAPLGSTGR